MSYVGFLDRVDGPTIYGWAMNADTKQPAFVDIFIDSTKIATIRCDCYREDLESVHGNGFLAFAYMIPESCRPEGEHLLSVRFTDTQDLLARGKVPIVFSGLTIGSVVGKFGFHAYWGRGLWCVDDVELRGGDLSVHGWALPPSMNMDVPTTVTVNGVPLDTCTRGKRQDVFEIYRPGHADVGFWGTICLPAHNISPERLCFRFVNGLSGLAFNENLNFYYCDLKGPFPDAARRKRVHGNESLASFLLEGSSAYMKLRRVLNSHFSKDFDDFGSVLDWGCGCGRVSLFLSSNHMCPLVGIDIDHDNIQWCRSHFPRGNFVHIDTEPPCSLKADSFDLIFGISIFTHLSESDQFKWLQELHRIAAPGAILMVSVHAESAWYRFPFARSTDDFVRWQSNGFLDAGRNAALDGVIRNRNYYRSTFHTAEYISKKWSAYFDIVDIIPGLIGNNQDLVVMKRL